MKDWIIQTNGLCKKYRGRYAVSNLNLRIGKGEIYGFLGPNGAGKTTAIKMMLGLIKPSKGSVSLFGMELRKERLRILRKVGSLVEYPSYYGHMSAVQNLEAVRRILDVPKQKIAEVLEIAGLTKEASRPVKGFSLGMKQRLGIASALLGSPELLILDEPTNGLDPSGILEIRELIKRLPKQHGITVLVSSHMLSEVEQMAGTIGIIRQGELVFQDTIANLQLQAKGAIGLVVSEPEKALVTIHEQGIHARRSASGIVIEQTNDATIAHMVKCLVEKQHAVYRVEEKKKSLEELFLQIVGEGKR